MFESCITTIVVSNEEMDDIMKIDKSLKEFGFSNKKTLAKQLKIKQKNKKEDLSVCY